MLFHILTMDISKMREVQNKGMQMFKVLQMFQLSQQICL